MRVDVRENWGLKLFSLLLSILLWGYVRFTQSVWTPQESLSEVHVTAVLALRHVSPDLMVVSAPRNVLVNVRGATAFVDHMAPGAVAAHVDLSDKPAGVYNLAVVPDVPKELTLLGTDPDRVNIVLDTETQRQIAVTLDPVGQPASGFTMGMPVLQPAVVTVQGPRGRVREVRDVKAHIELNNLETDVVQRVALEARDDRGTLVDDVTLSPRYVVVSIPIRSDMQTRTVPVVPTIEGVLPEGFELRGAQVDPPLVTITLPSGAPHPPLFLRTDPISVKGLRRTTWTTTRISAPDGITGLRDKDVRLKLEVIKRK